jgi:GNAT superfamily N-acetyltransferase
MYTTDKVINVHIRLGAVGLAEANLTMMDKGAIELWKAMSFEVSDRIKEPIAFFNRLLVPLSYRGNGVGRRLLGEVLHLAETHQFNILNQVSSSDPSFSNEKLVDFYVRYGFKVLHCDLLLYEFGKAENIARANVMMLTDPIVIPR